MGLEIRHTFVPYGKELAPEGAELGKSSLRDCPIATSGSGRPSSISTDLSIEEKADLPNNSVRAKGNDSPRAVETRKPRTLAQEIFSGVVAPAGRAVASRLNLRR